MAFGSKNSTPSFVLTLPMVIGFNEQDYLNKEFKKCGVIYNQLVNATTKMWHQLRKTRKYRELMAAIAKAAPDSDEQKALFKQREKMLKEYRFSEDAFHAMVVPYAKHYAINSHVAQSIATAVWTAWSSFFFDKGKEVHYKKLEYVSSISGKNNATGIMLRPANHTTNVINSAKTKAKNSIEKKYFAAYRKPDAKEGEEVVLPDEVKAQMEKEIAAATAKVKTSIGKGKLHITYGDYTFPVTLRNPDTQTGWYQQEALKCGVKYCRIIRKWVSTKWKYYAQIVLEGYPPIKCDNNGVAKHPVKQGRVGIDIGTQTIAFSGKDVCDLRVLAPAARAQAKSLVNEIASTLRAMDRSRRATNPKYYNPDGTIKRLKRQHGQKQKRKWKYSKRYYRLRAKLRNLYRKLADIRKMEHNILANELLTHGNEFVIEDMNYKALQKRSKETKINSKTGRAHTKKRFGKSLSRCAPAMFISILGKKANRYGGSVIKVSTFETKASQFDHTDESYTKKKLSERMARLRNGDIVQRDLYSAFLLEHIDTESLQYNMETLNSAFPAFLEMHENTKRRLQAVGSSLPASIGF
jgi:transposase